MQQGEKNYYPALTGIRAIAAWMVFVHHFNFFKPAFFGMRTYLFFSEMHIGVTVFFVLSGLLITLRYYDRPVTSGVSFYNYMVKRFARIYPAFFLILTVNFIWLLARGDFQNSFTGGWKYYLGAVSFLGGFFDHFAMQLVPQRWSLTVEECFYFSAPFIFFLLRKHIRNIIVLPFLIISAGILVTLYFEAHPFHGFFKDLRFLFNFTFFGRCIEFFAGIGVALMYKKINPERKRTAVYTITGSLMICLSLLSLSFLHTPKFYGDHHPLGIVINNLLLPVTGIAVLFWGLLTETNFITRLLSSKPMVLFGKSSYIFYLVHIGIAATFFYFSVVRNPLLLFIFLNILSVLLYKGFEHPVNMWLRKKLLRPGETSFPKTEHK